MASFESKVVRIIDKINERKFDIWKFKIKIFLASMNIWDIVDGNDEPLSSNVDPKILTKYQRRVKKTMFVIGFNWWTINLRASRIAKNMWRRSRPCTIFTRRKLCSTSSSFAASF